ncbi:MAG TPA: cell division protein FtsA [Bacteroidales bacterium]|nr:cell division protein FtsA [Bacteroidales bacterium]
MNQERKIIATVDIGTTTVVAAAGQKHSDGRMEVLGVEKAVSTGVKRGVILNIEETVTAIKQAVGALEERLDVKISEVFAGMAGYSMRSFTNSCYRFINKESEISTFDLDQLLRDSHRLSLEPGEKIIHVIPQEYSVDKEHSEKNPVGMSGQRLDAYFHVVTGKETALSNIEKCIQRAGLKMNGVVLESLASAEGVLTEEEKEAGVVLVDIGGGTTDMALFYDGILRHTAVIPFGGNVVTSDIKEGCSVLFKQAESLKVRFGSAMSSLAREDMVIAIPGMPGWEPREISLRSLSCIIQARMEEIVEYVARHIERSGYYDKLGAGIVLTGGGALLKHLPQLIRLKTGLDVRMGQPLLFQDTSYAEEELAGEPYATAVGLLTASAVYASPKGGRQQSLFEEEKLETPVESVETTARKVAKAKPKKSRLNREAMPGDLFGSLKSKIGNTFAGMFDDDDVEM